jgi:hypothetical protein
MTYCWLSLGALANLALAFAGCSSESDSSGISAAADSGTGGASAGSAGASSAGAAGAGSVGGTSGTAGTAGVGASGGATAAGNVVCGEQRCDAWNGEVCCAEQEKSPLCTDAVGCPEPFYFGTAKFSCDGPEDCPGQTCCYQEKEAGGFSTYCALDCGGYWPVCDDDSTCPDERPQCCARGSNLRVCMKDPTICP